MEDPILRSLFDIEKTAADEWREARLKLLSEWEKAGHTVGSGNVPLEEAMRAEKACADAFQKAAEEVNTYMRSRLTQ